MHTAETLPVGQLNEHVRVEVSTTANGTPTPTVFPSWELHGEQEFVRLMGLAGLSPRGNLPLRWRAYRGANVNWPALQVAVAWAQAYTGYTSLPTPIEDGEYDRYRVTSLDGTATRVAGAGPDDGPLRRIGVHWIGDGEYWIVPPQQASALREILHRSRADAQRRAARRSEIRRGEEQASLAAQRRRETARASQTDHVTVENLDRERVALRFSYNETAAQHCRTSGASWDSSQRHWLLPLSTDADLSRIQALVNAVDLELHAVARRQDEEARLRAEATALERARCVREANAANPRLREFLPVGDRPPLGTVRQLHGQWVVVEHYGREFRITEDHPSEYGSHLLGHEGEYASYVYHRPATAEEIAETQAAQAREAAETERARRLETLWTTIRNSGEFPQGVEPVGAEVTWGNTLHQERALGAGHWLVVGEEWVWAIQGHTADGDSWTHNNVTAGLGWRLRRTPEHDELLGYHGVRIGYHLENLDEVPAPLRHDTPLGETHLAFVELDDVGVIRADWEPNVPGDRVLPLPVFEGRVRRWYVDPNTRGEALAQFLQRPPMYGLFQRVRAGLAVAWDDQHFTGHLDADAEAAEREIATRLDEFCATHLVDLWTADDWLADSVITEVWPQGVSLGASVADVVAEAARNRVMLVGDVTQAILDLARAQGREEN